MQYKNICEAHMNKFKSNKFHCHIKQSNIDDSTAIIKPCSGQMNTNDK